LTTPRRNGPGFGPATWSSGWMTCRWKAWRWLTRSRKCAASPIPPLLWPSSAKGPESRW